jgi:hypothetical protein
MKYKAFVSILAVLSTLIFSQISYAFPWWATPAAKWVYKFLLSSDTSEEILEKALTSNDPEKVELCLDKLIEQKHYIYISRVKLRVDNKIREVRKEILVSQTINPETIKKQLKPWIKIRNKAQYFFTRKDQLETSNP